MLTDKRFWRTTAWPTLLFTLAYLVYTPELQRAWQAWADAPPNWSESGIPVEFSTRGRGTDADESLLLGKAAELDNHPVLIYEFVRNSVEFEPYSGTRFGAVGALHRGRANDVDQSLLLAALLRAAYRNLGREEPKLWLVRGEVRFRADRAMAWLGAEDAGELVRIASHMRSCGMHGAAIAPDSSGDLTLRDHVWLRGELEFGPHRGARTIEGNDGILVDLDPSFAPQVTLPPPSRLALNDDALRSQVRNAPDDLQEGSAGALPEALMLTTIDLGAAEFRRLLDEEGIGAEQALLRRRPTRERVDALPDALPFELVGPPVTCDLRDAVERDPLLAMLRHRTRLVVETETASGDTLTLTEAIGSTSEFYGRTLSVSFVPEDDPTTETLSMATTEPNALPPVRARVALDGVAISAPGEAVAYGTPVRLRVASQQGSFAFESSRPDPMQDASASTDAFETVAGAMFALAVVPGLNAGSLPDYTARQIALQARVSGGDYLTTRPAETPDNPATPPKVTAEEALAPSLDLAAQAMLGQAENFTRLGALATGGLGASLGEWAIAGLEPVRISSPDGEGFSEPRFVFATSRSAGVFTSIVDPVESDRYFAPDGVKGLIRLARDAMLYHGPELALGTAVRPVTAGRLIRDANKAALATYEIEEGNAQLLDEGTEARARRVPFADLASDIQSKAVLENRVFLLPPAETLMSDGEGALGLAWGNLSRGDVDGVWRSEVVDSDGRRLSAFSPQENEEKLTPGDLIAGGRASHYERLANASLAGAIGYEGAVEATSQAFAAAARPLAELARGNGLGGVIRPSLRAKFLGSLVVALHAMLDEFSRAEVRSIRLNYVKHDESTGGTTGSTTGELAPGDVFNPARMREVTARGLFSQIVDEFRFQAYDGPNENRGTFTAVNEGLRAHADWTMKTDESGATDAFAFVTRGTPEIADDYNGPIELRLRGEINGRETRERSERFVIDTRPPDVHIIPWHREGEDPDSEVTFGGRIAIRGHATDEHFRSYRVEVKAPGAADTEENWTRIFPIGDGDVEAVAGAGVLAYWDTAQGEGVPLQGRWSVRVTADDLADNEASVVEEVQVRNDGIAPEILIAARPDGTAGTVVGVDGGTLAGRVILEIKASDDPGAAPVGVNSGLVYLKVWAKYKPGFTFDEDGFAPLPGPPGQVAQVQLFERSYDLPVPRVDLDLPLDTIAFQSSDPGFEIGVVAVDAFDNGSNAEKSFTLNNPIFSATLEPRAIVLTEPPASRSSMILSIFHGSTTSVGGRVLDSDGEVVRENLLPAGTSPVGAGGLVSKFAWNGENDGGVDLDPGAYFVEAGVIQPVPQGPVIFQPKMSFDAALLPVSASPPTPPNAFIDFPRSTLIEKDKFPSLPVTGFAVSSIMEELNAAIPPTDTRPIRRLLPASEPYWILSYKPSTAEPVIAGGSIPSNFFSANIARESNWREIAHGFRAMGAPGAGTDPRAGAVMATLGTWDVASLPSGTYDLRLVVTDGTRYATAVAPGYRVVNSTDEPGTDPDDATPGVLKLRQVDLSVNFEGFPLEVARIYSSARASVIGDFGYGWRLDGLGMNVVERSSTLDSIGLVRTELDITLPDGRTLPYASEPPTSFQLTVGADRNAWLNERAFVSRPYGQMLWQPGAFLSSGLLEEIGFEYATKDSLTEGYRVARQLVRDRLDLPELADLGAAAGAYYVLRLEDGTFLVYEKGDNGSPGRLVRRDYDDGERKLDFYYAGDESALPASENGEPIDPRETRIVDNLGRRVRIIRNAKGFISRIVDPRGFHIDYEYNGADELIGVSDRLGNKRFLGYDKPQWPHYLTSVTVDRQPNRAPYVVADDVETSPSVPVHGRADDHDTRIDYDYTNLGKLASIDTGDGGGRVKMEYRRGVQTVVDEATGGRTEVHYDTSGRVRKKVNPAGVISEFDYFPASGEPSLTGPAGVMSSETVGGIRHEYEYDLGRYGPVRPRGFDGIAQSYLDFWLTRLSDGQYQNDYDGANEIDPGYLTEFQIQPSELATPAVDERGDVLAEPNRIAIQFNPSGDDRPDGTGRIYGLADASGVSLSLQYGTGAHDRNEIGSVTSPSANSVRTFVSSGRFAGRPLQETITEDELVSTTTYEYEEGTADSFPETAAVLSFLSLEGEARQGEFFPAGGDTWVELAVSRHVIGDGVARIQRVFRDASGFRLLTASFEEGSDSRETLIDLPDAEGRSALSIRGTARTRTFYDGAGSVIRTETTEGGRTFVTTYELDALGRVVETSVDGHASRTLHVAGPGGVRREIFEDSDGSCDSCPGTNRSYRDTDAAGNIVRTVSESGDANPLTGVPSFREETLNRYDLHGRLEQVSRSGGALTRMAYDEAGRVVRHSTFADGTTETLRTGYDRFDRLAWEQTPAQSLNGIFTTYLYRIDVDGDLTPWTDIDDVPEGPDDPLLGQLVGIYYEDRDELAANNEPAAEPGGPGYRGDFVEWRIDDEGNLVSRRPFQRSLASPPEVVETVVASDAGDDESARVFAAGHPEELRIGFERDDRGELVGALFPSGIRKDWIQFRDLDADPDVDRVLETQPSISGSLPLADTHFDEDGQEASVQDGAGARIAFIREEGRLLRTEHLEPGATVPSLNHRWSYSEDGRIESVESFHGATADPTSRFHFETLQNDPSGLHVTGRLTPAGDIRYAYDVSGRLESVAYLGQEVRYERDGRGRIRRVQTPRGTWSYVFDAAGQVASITSDGPEGRLHEEWTRDALGRVTGVTHRREGESEPFFSVAYDLGVDGSILGATEHRGDEVVRWDYQHDALLRLVRETRTDSGGVSRDRRYEYDQDGFRSREIDETLPAGSPARVRAYRLQPGTHRLDSIRDGLDRVIESFEWTANGEMASRTVFDPATGAEIRRTLHSWGIGGLLRSVEIVGEGRIEFDYDAGGELVGRREYRDGEAVPFDHVRYLVDPGENPTGRSQTLAEVDGFTGALRRANFFGDRLAGAYEPGRPGETPRSYRLAGDLLGSNRARVGPTSGAAPEAMDYSAFGTPLGARPSGTGTTHGFTGERIEARAGLQYHRARWLAPDLGAWLSADPVFDLDGNFGSAYGYAGQSPLHRTDPSGRISMLEQVIVSAIVSYMNESGLENAIWGIEQGRSVLAAYGEGDLADSMVTTIRIALLVSMFIGIVGLAVGLARLAIAAVKGTIQIGRWLMSSAGRQSLGRMQGVVSGARTSARGFEVDAPSFVEDATDDVGDFAVAAHGGDDIQVANRNPTRPPNPPTLPPSQPAGGFTHVDRDDMKVITVTGRGGNPVMVCGSAQTNTSLDHQNEVWFQIWKKISESDDIEYVVVNRTLRTALGKQFPRKMGLGERPDLIIVRKGSPQKVEFVEVASESQGPRTQARRDLRANAESQMAKLPKDSQGGVEIIELGEYEHLAPRP